MDDDDFYPKNHVLTRIKILLQNPSKQFTGCIGVGCYDIVKNNCFTTDGDMKFSEASMAYTRNFFNQRNFNELIQKGEGTVFISGRQMDTIQIPYPFILIAITHNKNVTNTIRTCDHDNNGDENPFQIEERGLNILKEIRKNL